MHVTVRLQRIGGKDVSHDHNFHLGSAVYEKLKNSSDEAANALHESHYRSAYVLSEIHRVGGKPGEAWFRVGTSNEAVLRAISKALTPSLKLPVGGTEYMITGLQIEEPIVRPGEYVTLSPILLRDKETGKSLVHDSPGYKESLEAAMNAQVKNYLKIEGEIKLIHFEPQAVFTRTIKEKKFLAQKGRMLLDGPEEQLRFLVNHGVGRSPALGFGMVVGTDYESNQIDEKNPSMNDRGA